MVGSLSETVPPAALVPTMLTAGNGLVGLNVQSGMSMPRIVSVQDVKVRLVSVPEIDEVLAFLVTSASKNVWLQVIVPTLGIVRTAGSAVVLVRVVDPVSRAPPGSVRNAVDADADAAPRAKRPRAAIAISEASFRMVIIFLQVART
jgi:hypothetical protein